ncbi:hypothetical protein GF351_05445 [Candidatus Woesearchaeota archaeon]|nr:hypothetical protein [Candidatus Woesearchaeota archaeon]
MKNMILLVMILAFMAVFSGCRAVQCPACPDCVCPECKEPVCPACNPYVEQEIVTKYVCPDERVVENLIECRQEPIEFEPVTTNEQGSIIDLVEVYPACVYATTGGVIHYRVGTVPDSVTVQVKDSPEGNWQDVCQGSKEMEGYVDFAVCESNCHWKGEFQLLREKVYLVRVEFDFRSVYGEKQYSNEHIVDARSYSEYTDRVCKKE